MRSGGCVYLAGENGRLDVGKTLLLLLLKRTRREECLCVYAIAKIIIANKGESGLRFKTYRQENRLRVFHFVILTIKREE